MAGADCLGRATETLRRLRPGLRPLERVFYRLAGIQDVGRLAVHMMTGKGYDERGVIGLGEPPVISPGAAISNGDGDWFGPDMMQLMSMQNVANTTTEASVRLMRRVAEVTE